MGFFSGIPGIGKVIDKGISSVPIVGDVVGALDDVLTPEIPGVDPYTPDAERFRFDNEAFNQRMNDPAMGRNRQQTLDYRNQLFGNLQDRISGEAPSVAEQQFAQSLDQLRAQQASQAASQGAYNPAAQRAAAYNAAQIGQQGAGQAALLRAGEQASAEQLFANALSQARAQDVSQQLGYEQIGLGREQGASQARQAYDEALLRKYLGQIGQAEAARGRQSQGVGALLGGAGAAAAGAA